MFREWDVDSDGTISKKEFRRGVHLLRLVAKKVEVTDAPATHPGRAAQHSPPRVHIPAAASARVLPESRGVLAL